MKTCIYNLLRHLLKCIERRSRRSQTYCVLKPFCVDTQTWEGIASSRSGEWYNFFSSGAELICQRAAIFLRSCRIIHFTLKCAVQYITQYIRSKKCIALNGCTDAAAHMGNTSTDMRKTELRPHTYSLTVYCILVYIYRVINDHAY
jgi:hypothetical protein